jgi:hypothetical protein
MNNKVGDYGQKMNSALSAVRRMHSDVSKLLVDVDSTIGKGMNPIFGSYATTNLTYNYKADYWMAAFVYRLYSDAEKPGIVKGITVWFFDDSNQIAEPLLLVGELQYELAPEQTLEKTWVSDLINAYSKWHASPTTNVVLTGRTPKPAVRSYRVIASPLYSITSMADVVELMDRVQQADLPEERKGT